MPRSKQAPRLDCRHAAQRTTEFLEGRLSAPMRAQFVRHLEACSACSAYAHQIALVSGALRRLPPIPMRASDRRKLLARLKARR